MLAVRPFRRKNTPIRLTNGQSDRPVRVNFRDSLHVRYVCTLARATLCNGTTLRSIYDNCGLYNTLERATVEWIR